MIILGVDPGTGCTGYGFIRTPSTLVGCGTIRPPSKATLEAKLLFITERLGELISEHRPEQCAVENIFHAVNAHSALILGHIRGAIIVRFRDGVKSLMNM